MIINSIKLSAAKLCSYQFAIEPIQYFIITRIGFLPSLYLGRVITILFILRLIFLGKSGILIKSLNISLSKYPFAPFLLYNIICGVYPIFYYSSLVEKIRFGIVEPLIYITYIIVFIILPKLVLDESTLRKLPRIILTVFNWILIIGFIDIIFSSLGKTFLGRSIFDRIYIGTRFHSITNEPRDYVVAGLYYLICLSIFSISPLVSENFKKYKKLFTKIILPIGLFSIILTKSATSILTIILYISIKISSVILTLFNSLISFKIKKSTIFIFSVIAFIIYGLIYILLQPDILELIGAARLNIYVLSITELLDIFNEKAIDITEVILGAHVLNAQLSVWYPLYIALTPNDLSDFINLIIGHGHGSVSFLISSFKGDYGALYNSFSSLTRLIYENGVIGLGSFLYIYWWITSNVVFDKKSNLFDRSLYYTLSLLLLCAFLVHRRQEYFLFIGLTYLYLIPNRTQSRVDP